MVLSTVSLHPESKYSTQLAIHSNANIKQIYNSVDWQLLYQKKLMIQCYNRYLFMAYIFTYSDQLSLTFLEPNRPLDSQCTTHHNPNCAPGLLHVSPNTIKVPQTNKFRVETIITVCLQRYLFHFPYFSSSTSNQDEVSKLSIKIIIFGSLTWHHRNFRNFELVWNFSKMSGQKLFYQI